MLSPRIASSDVMVSELVDRPAKEDVRQLEILFDGKLPVCSFDFHSPRLKYRGFMLDVSRHFFSVKEIENILDVMSLAGFNVFHWHLTDDQGWRFGVEGYERLETVGSKRYVDYYDGERLPESGFYTDDDLKEVVEAEDIDRNVIVMSWRGLKGAEISTSICHPFRTT